MDHVNENLMNLRLDKDERDKGMLVIISGPSGSGKGTVVKQLYHDKNFALSISMTTRQSRQEEVEGVDYFFCTKDEFIEARDNNELLEHAVYMDNFYGTPKKYVEQQISEQKFVVLEIEVTGALQVKELYPDAVLIFLLPPTFEELSRRLITRNTEDSLTIEARLRRAQEELLLINQYDYLVINDEIENAVRKINNIVYAEKLRPKRLKGTINKFRGEEYA